jgi:uncharacterized membrane protein
MNWDIKRWLRHEFTTRRTVHRALPPETLQHLTQAIAAGEKNHGGEIRLAVEAKIHARVPWHHISAHQRALQVFSHLRVWDTEANNGVLIYLLFADRHVQIIADRAIDRVVGTEEWSRICRVMETFFRQGEFEEGLRQGIVEISKQLEKHFPHGEALNELPDEPVIL